MEIPPACSYVYPTLQLGSFRAKWNLSVKSLFQSRQLHVLTQTKARCRYIVPLDVDICLDRRQYQHVGAMFSAVASVRFKNPLLLLACGLDRGSVELGVDGYGEERN